MKIKKGSNAVGICVAVIILILTIVRLVIGIRIPLLIQGDARYDDFMLVEYAENILSGKWLGDYSYKAMIKTASFPLLLDLGYKLGISYSWMLNCLYIAAVALLSVAMNKLIGNRIFAVALYLFMLFSPVMLHEENVQKVYRGGYIVVFAVFIVAAVIGLFAYYEGKTQVLAGFSAILSLSLPVFWYLKEDSVWIMPFVICGLICTLIRSALAKNGKKFLFTRIACCIIPLIVMVLSMSAYRSINLNTYGVYADTDRNGTYFQEVVEDLLQIEGASIDKSWVTQDALHEATLASDTLRKMAYELDMTCYTRLQDDGEVHGDFIIWALRESADAHGIYTSATDAENYWKQVHEELTDAFENGELKRSSNKIYLSNVAVGFTKNELRNYYLGRLGETLRTVITYDHNCLTLKEASGEDEQIKRMHKLVKSDYIGPSTTDEQMKSYERTVAFANRINRLYGITGKLVILAAFVGTLFLLIRFVAGIKNKTSVSEGWILLLTIGMALTAGLVVFAVMWFCNFLTIWKIYDYSCGAVIMMQIIEAIGVYYLVDTIISFVKKKTGRSI